MPTPLNRLAGKVAIVTGAASGIGAATARLFAEEGAVVIAVDRPASAILTAHAGQARIVALAQDVTDPDAPETIVAAAVREGGGLDILFNNAGVSANALGELTTDAQWDNTFAVNARAVFRMCRAAIPALRARAEQRLRREFVSNDALMAYFDRFPGVWAHGDFASLTEHGGWVIHGRSDATLNRHGIRMGSADIYEVVEGIDAVTEAFVVGIDGPGGDYWMPLFVTMAEGSDLDEELVGTIRTRIRTVLSPRHVPDEVIAAPGIPHTRTGKKLEVPVTAIMAGRSEVSLDPRSIDRPELIDWYRDQGLRHRWTGA